MIYSGWRRVYILGFSRRAGNRRENRTLHRTTANHRWPQSQ